MKGALKREKRSLIFITVDILGVPLVFFSYPPCFFYRKGKAPASCFFPSWLTSGFLSNPRPTPHHLCPRTNACSTCALSHSSRRSGSYHSLTRAIRRKVTCILKLLKGWMTLAHRGLLDVRTYATRVKSSHEPTPYHLGTPTTSRSPLYPQLHFHFLDSYVKTTWES